MTNARSTTRRALLKAGLATSVVVAGASPARAAPRGPVTPLFEELERTHGARLGVFARNTRTGTVVAHREHERFAMCSTFKTIVAAEVLRDHDRCAPLDKLIHFPPADILPNSPVTGPRVDTGVTVADACAGAIQYSDNTAGNLLLRQVGGPAGLTRFLRSIGDDVSRLDRWETELNAAVPGDLRDTTTPSAMGQTYERLMLGRALTRPDRDQLVTWLKGNTTSAARFRAGLPSTWTLGDKTGTGAYASAHDVGVAWTTRGTPLLLCVLTSKDTADAPVDNALIADAARILARALAADE